ncbi:MBL fold metallo-hydrolase [Kaustia mangrovi]|uniref:MBL fold metallo-hydrolase n=1 Tax=Kaustia mangrovi TaxID=2593653 RepID=A0A7S8C5J5_9HYPH|nr:MBL fold metallo-hydrolase [Kaustia mangrovi]QPC43731.1 MBL fold metallo-hydrolase [Kaustia mangrovi]
MVSDQFLVRFWGVRGSLACGGERYSRYGGNTPCVEMRCGDHVLVFDGGTGLRDLGNRLVEDGVDRIDLFFSHCHYDHIEGLPFFAPFYHSKTTVRLWSGHHLDGVTTKEMLEGYMHAPYFPIAPDMFKARLLYEDFTAGDTLAPHEGLRIDTARLTHCNGSAGYRVTWGGRTACYVTDTEHTPGRHDEAVLALIEGADLVIYDTTFTDNEFACCKGYGHSTWREGTALCELAGAKQLVMFHHNPDHDDDRLAAIEKEAQAARASTIAAREGLCIAL